MENVIPPSVLDPDTIFDKINEEAKWYDMLHGGNKVSRKVALQGDIFADGSIPLYRYPTDTMHKLSPWSPTVEIIKNYLNEKYKININQAKIQLYSNGRSKIGDHSDKTLDIMRESEIMNMSFGASRTFHMKHKSSGEIKEYKMTNNSMITFDMMANRLCWHGVSAEPEVTKPRISIVFRQIGTFLLPDGRVIGQGAPDGEDIPSEEDQAKKLLTAYGKENKKHDFDWDKWYGCGYTISGLKPK
jgi:alkylated DNA repair dioxygenase AlkB